MTKTPRKFITEGFSRLIPAMGSGRILTQGGESVNMQQLNFSMILTNHGLPRSTAFPEPKQRTAAVEEYRKEASDVGHTDKSGQRDGNRSVERGQRPGLLVPVLAGVHTLFLTLKTLIAEAAKGQTRRYPKTNRDALGACVEAF